MEVGQGPSPPKNQVHPSFPCRSHHPPGRPGSSQDPRCAPRSLSHQVLAGTRAPPQGAAGAPGFCRRKDVRTRVWLRSRRLREAERGAFSGTAALGSPGLQHPAGSKASHRACSLAVSLLSIQEPPPQVLSVTCVKRGWCAIFSWSSWPGIMAIIRPGP